MPRIRFAGQITGCEGYVESASVGIMAGRFAAAQRLGFKLTPPPPTTAMGAMLGHITGGADAETFQPMNVNFGLMPPLPPDIVDHKGRPVRGPDKKQAQARRALADMREWVGAQARAAA
jgi:methylenetetrahydrofolate--tRNA-(uracil-5-)-methyltransferase